MRATWAAAAVAIISMLVGACGGGNGESSSKITAQQPEMVAKAEDAVNAEVAKRLTSSRQKYPGDAQVFPAGDASCRPFSDFQLDCIQRIKDESNPWTGETKWRATVNADSGSVTIEEHGGTGLQSHLDNRSVCIAVGDKCDVGAVE